MGGMKNPDWKTSGGPRFVSRPGHRQWLRMQASALLDFFQPAVLNPAGGFFTLNRTGQPMPPKPEHTGQERWLHDTSRMVHSFAIAKLLGRPGADDIIDHGMDFLWARHRDTKNGGYFWGVDDSTASNPVKQAYGHAFVLLAAASAKMVGHADADRLLADVSEVLLSRFWEPDFGATSEEYTADWQAISGYHGQNSNMHLTEALMAACEATGDNSYLEMAESVAALLINRHARSLGWRVAEHFDADWQVDAAYAGNPVFRPSGITPGHALEWSRLLIQLWKLGKRRHDWMPDAATQLFLKAAESGWSPEAGGLFYTLDWNNKPDQTERYWWPCAEGIAAASVLGSATNDSRFEGWYRRIWAFTDAHIIDHECGGWYPELDDTLKPTYRVFAGKPDIYHALQACLIPLLPSDCGILRGLQRTGLRLEPVFI